jgi:phosphate uptake regulator
MEHDHRRLIKFGNSSHIISLPNNWIKKHKLKKGDLIYIEENGNGEMILSSEIKKITNETNIEYDDLDELNRKLISSYIAGYDIIKIKVKNLNHNDLIRSYLEKLMSFEIVYQLEDKIIAKDLLDIKETQVINLIRRIDTINQSMFEDSKSSYKEKNYENIYKRDIYINKLTYLCLRILKKCLEDPNLIKKVGLKNDKLIEIWELITSLENIGDNIKRISGILTRIGNTKKLNGLLLVYNKVYKEYVEAMKSYYKNNKLLAYQVSSKKGEIINECNDLAKKHGNNPNIINMLEKIKTIEVLTRNICRSVYQ